MVWSLAMFERVRHRQTFFSKLWYIYGQRLHRWMIAKDTNVYLKPNDIISHCPTLFGMHEPHIEALITEASTTHGDFLLDIGANIGMTSALLGRWFKRVDCVEPNQLVVNILKTNLAMNLSATEHEVHAVGLGKEDGVFTLRVPANNFGGAYVEDGNPQFDGETAAQHSNQFSDRSNHLALDVVIWEAGQWLDCRFTALREAGFRKGVIKIDVEGYEEVIFGKIIKTLPDDFSAVVVMENWFDRFPVSRFSSARHSLAWYYVQKRRRILHSIPFKLLGLSSSYDQVVAPLDDDTKSPHDVICLIGVAG